MKRNRNPRPFRHALLLVLASSACHGLGCETQRATTHAPERESLAPATSRAPEPSAAPEGSRAPEANHTPEASTAHSDAERGELEAVTVTLGGKTEATLPWIVALHGLGDSPESFSQLLQGAPFEAHVYVLRAPYHYGRGYDWLRARLSSEPSTLSAGIRHAAQRVERFIDRTGALEKTRGKPIVLGFSQGGILSFTLATRRPSSLLLAVPIGGALPPMLWPDTAREGAAPIVALHGTDDRVIPIAPTRALVEHLRQVGFNARLDAFDGVAHRITGAVRERLFATISHALAGSE